MAHFAELDSLNKVLRVIVVNNETLGFRDFPESEEIGQAFCRHLYGPHTLWKQTSYNGNFRKNYAGAGYFYNPTLDAFIPPKPFDSWIFDSRTCQWYPPKPYPTDGETYTWNESQKDWERRYLIILP